jgi:hypothetical protein
LFALAGMAHFSRIAFTYDMQFFPNVQTLVFQHLHKAIETPIVVDHAVTDLPLASFFGSLTLMPFDDHLPLGKIADHHMSNVNYLGPPMATISAGF